MKSPIHILAATAVLAGFAAAETKSYVSLEQEMRQAIARGNAWLKEQQKAPGNWGDEGLPAFTALALTAAVRDPNSDPKAARPEHIVKGYNWLLAQQKPDGGIYNRGLSNYNTATALTALMAAANPNYDGAAIKARKSLVAGQWDVGQKGAADNPNDGGIGYGSKDDHTDLSNTYLAIEALRLSERLVKDGEYANQPDLDWDAAVKFISRCQNNTATNDQPGVSNDGGFFYTPGESKAGKEETKDGREALRSYGSMSYAGLLSLIYAKVDAKDPRVIAVKEWLAKNYSVSANPGMGAEGLYYYYQTMAKSLTAANIGQLELADGKTADWRDDLGRAILKRQRENGSWVNENGRWMESDPVLVTSYTVLALEQLCASIPRPAPGAGDK